MKRIGIINRGEAATRFQATVDALRREDPTAPDAVALYTDADADALFVRTSAVSERIGEGRTAYLDVEAVIAALQRADCDAAWPGWGFASEDAAFAEALEAAGITYLGPRPETTRQLGDKIAAKLLAVELGVPVAPWAIVDDEADLPAQGAEVGYPLLVKASGAGGGRGIRRVDAPEQLLDAVHSASAEAARSFGQGGILLERCLDAARHIEVQLLGDGEGNVLVLGTRDCSLQRKRQKVIEECPAPDLPDAIRERLLTAARALGEATRYRSAGTVEFLYQPATQMISFLEVNARLQVEHPVTETVFGLDLCRAQIDVARGLPLPTPLPERGHAFEARVCAEDPTADFAPSPGVLARFQLPSGPGLRVDTGFTVGDSVSADFDTLLAKVIAWGPTRETARARLSRALHQMRIVARGGRANLDFLRTLADGEALATPADIGFIDRLNITAPPDQGIAIIAAAIDRFLMFGDRSNSPDRHHIEAGERVSVFRIGPEHFRIVGPDGAVTCRRIAPMLNQTWLTLGGRRYRIERAPGDTTYIVDGTPHRVAQASGGAVVSPSIALVLDVAVKPGDAVVAGQTLAVVESMKMELQVEAPLAGTVREIRANTGAQVLAGQVLLVIDPEDDAEPAAPIQMPWSVDCLDAAQSADRVRWRIIGWDSEPVLDAADRAALRPEDSLPILQAFADIADLFERRPIRGDDRGRGGADAVNPSVSLETLRRQGPQAVPKNRLARLRRAFAWHGIEDLAPDAHGDQAALRDVVLRLTRAGARLGESQRTVAALLRSTDKVPVRLLDRLAALDGKGLPQVVKAARRARYRIYEAPALEDLAERAEARVARVFGADGLTPDWPALMSAPESLLAVLANAAVTGDVLAGEAVARRLEWVAPDYPVTQLGPMSWAIGPCLVWIGRPADAAAAVTELAKRSERCQRLDVVLVPSDADPAGPLLQHAPTLLPIGPAQTVPWDTVCLMVPTRQQSRLYTADGAEIINRRNIPPTTERRIDLNRLSAFDFERVTTGNDSTLFLAQSKTNPDDRRLLSHVEVRSLRRRKGRPLHLPDVDRVFHEAARAMEAALEIHDTRRRMHWNRLTIVIRPVVPIGPDVVQRYVGRLAPSAAHLGLEKVVVRARFADASADGGVGPSLDLSISNLADNRPEFSVKPTSSQPLRSRSRYESRVVSARRRGLTYPYELISLLEKGGELLPAGRFEEYDLAPDGAAVSVGGRPRGQNTAGVIFGIMRAPVAQLPQGLTRVLLLSDPTRRMGALAEDECVRVLAAIDLAERLGVPVEWIAVSAGARVDWATGTENLDWTAQVLRRIVRFTQAGGEINVLVPGICVGAQSYWNAEATMMMHCRGLLVMTSRGSMVLTGKRALDFSGCVSAEDDIALGGYTAIMGPNGQAQAYADDLAAAMRLLHRYYAVTYVPPGQMRSPHVPSADPDTRDITQSPYPDLGHGFETVGDIFSATLNRDRKRPFAARPLMKALVDSDNEPVERWAAMRGAETAIVYETRIGGYCSTLIGIDNQPVARLGQPAADGPETLAAGTLYPQAARKVARALNAASGRRPAVILANLSGFDGSPESLGAWQLEYGAEIGRAVVNFDGPILFVVVSRYHGGAYVVFSKKLNENLEVVALSGSYASVLGGAPAAAVVFAGETRRLAATLGGGPEAHAQATADLAAKFDGIHTVERAQSVGSIDGILEPKTLRPWVIERLRRDALAHAPEAADPLDWDQLPSTTPPPIGDH